MITTMVQCPPPEELQAFSRGQLSGEDSDALVIHLSSCAACQSQLETVSDEEDSLIASLRGAGGIDEYADEAGYSRAMAQALAALASGGTKAGTELESDLPEIIGEYRIVRPLGRGGMGSVYLARHTKLNREVALKLLAHHRLGNPRVRERFEVEMQAVGRLSHPNVVAAHDARDVDGTAVLVTEYIDGFDLGQLLARVGPLTPQLAAEIIRQVALALEYTSSQGFVHRDVKPSNIMLSRLGKVKLLDLGLARIQWDEEGQREMTGTGEAMGTADYMAPEQVSDSRSVDVRADIYSLGCTLFKLLTGLAPFSKEETAFAKMTSHVSAQPPSISEYCSGAPGRLVNLVDAMLSKDADNRPQSPLEVATELKAIVGGSEEDLRQSLVQLVADARAKPSQAATTLPPAIKAVAAQTQSQKKPWLPASLLVATGLVALIAGIFLGALVTIRYPDGTVAKLVLPEGSQLEIRSAEDGARAGDGAASAEGGTTPAASNGRSGSDATDFVHFELKYVTSLWMKLQLMDFFQEEHRKEPAGEKKMKFVDDGESILVVRHATPSRLATIRKLIQIYDKPQKNPPRGAPPRAPAAVEGEEGVISETIEPAAVREIRVESRPPLQMVVLRQDLASSGTFPSPSQLPLGLADPQANTRWIPLAPSVEPPEVSKSAEQITYVPTLFGGDDVVRWEEILGHTSAMMPGGAAGIRFTFGKNLTARIAQLLERHRGQSLGIVFNGEVVAILQSKGKFSGQLLLRHNMTPQEIQYLMGSLSGDLVEELPSRSRADAAPGSRMSEASVLRRLRGLWQAVSIVDPASTGDKPEGAPPLTFRFRGNEYHVAAGEASKGGGVFSLRRTRDGLQIDMYEGFGDPKGEPREGIMRFNDRPRPGSVDQFELHFRADAKRPLGFDQSGNSVVILQRIKSAPGEATVDGETANPNAN